jgi:hypothetical protein
MGRKLASGWRWQRVIAFLIATVLAIGVFSCAKPTAPRELISAPTIEPNPLAGKLTEVSPPESLQLLKQAIDAYTPQVRILTPRPGEVIDKTSVAVRFQVRGLPIFKDQRWSLGPHLHVFLDNEPYRAIYDLSEPLIFDDLAPGTHTLRVFASRPWHESFKNQGAFDQRTFHVFAQTPQDELDADQPSLTYSRPQGHYGAEPIMLDFYLNNAPLHMAAQADPKDTIQDWRIRCTVNGESFVFDQWQPIYLEGFHPGKNWVQLELIDAVGQPIENRFNNTVRVIEYEPGGDDTLSQLVRGELDARAVAGIIDPTYVPPAELLPPSASEQSAPTDEIASPDAPSALEEPVAPSVSEPADNSQETEPTPELPSPAGVLPIEPLLPSATEDALPTAEKAEPTLEEPVTSSADIENQAPETDATPDVPVREPALTPERSDNQSAQESATILEEAETQIPAVDLPADMATDESASSEAAAFPSATPEEMPSPEAEPLPVTDPVKLEAGEPSFTTDDTQPQVDDDPPQTVNTERSSSSSEEPIDSAGDALILDKPEKAPLTEPPDTSATPNPSFANRLLERYQYWRHQVEDYIPGKTTPPEPSSAVEPNGELIAPPPNREPPNREFDKQSTGPVPPPPTDPSAADNTLDPEIIREMPELVEPYLTEPYLTEPRLDIVPFEDDILSPSETDQKPRNPASEPAEIPSLSEGKPFI